MSKFRRSHCRDCGASGNDVPISKTGLCPPCGERRLLANVHALQSRQGHEYERWLTGCAVQVAARVTAELDADASSD